jgi:RHS repeat-associated protein
MDIYAIRNEFYNGYIGVEAAELPPLNNFEYYTDQYVIDGSNIRVMYLYQEVISDVGLGDFPWYTNDGVDLFTEKVKRFEAITDLYDTGIPEDVMADETEADVEAELFAMTGICPLVRDLEIFLSELTADGYLVHGTALDADAFDALTTDLYLEMGGDTDLAGDIVDTYTNEIHTTVSGSTMTIQVENAGTGDFTKSGGGTMSTIVLNEPSGTHLTDIDPGWTTWNWSDITALRMLWHEPGTTYDFEILAEMEVTIGGEVEYKEVVLTGTTGINIGLCDLNLDEALCDKDENFGRDIQALFTHFFDGTSDLTDHTASNAATELDGWYESSELFAQMGDNPLAPISTVASSSSTNTITLYNSDLDRQMKAVFSFIPSDIDVITGSTYDKDANDVTIYYITTSGTISSFTGSITLVSDPGGADINVLNLDCMCDAENEMALGLESLFNELIGVGNFAGASELSPYTSDAVQVLSGVYGGDVAIESFFWNTTNFNITLVDGGATQCDVTLNLATGYSGNLDDIRQIYGVEVTESATEGVSFTLTAFAFLDGDDDGIGEIVELEMTLNSIHAGSCFKKLECECEYPPLLAPESCSEKWVEYHDVIDPLNTSLDEENQFESYSEEDFCGTRMAWAVDAYLQYRTHVAPDDVAITSNEDDYYVSLSTFGSNGLNHLYLDDWTWNDVTGKYESGSDDTLDVIQIYRRYLGDPANAPYLGWNKFINEVYLVDSLFCPPYPLPYYPTIDVEIPCELYTANVDSVNAKNQKEIYLEKLAENFRERYVDSAMTSLIETFSATSDDQEFHYTLYYYDQAGNLVQTVPPKGVDRIDDEINQSEIDAARATNDNTTNAEVTDKVLPEHSYQTQYHYNSLNQLVWQETPDGGDSYFGYDELGRLVVSQNKKQREAGTYEQFSYTRYDELGRIVEVGEMTLNSDYGFDENGRFISPTATLVDVSASSFPSGLLGFVSAEEVTKTKYDELEGLSSSEFEDYLGDNTRNRITGVYYYEDYTEGTDDFTTYDNATFYDYDVHGNVKELVQKINDEHLEDLEHDIKKVDYEYDLVSGNVKHVTYQKGEADQFIHEYEYDADNRITNVRTSRDEVIWEQDAKYFYYDHGPLARTEIGDQKVAANDYAYTIQGWLKGVNSEDLAAGNDQGKDSQTGMNRMNGKDVYGYSLHYFANDYEARFDNDFLAYSELTTMPDNQSLFNGNIRQMYTAASDVNEANIGTNHTVYKYDQLNRIKEMAQELLSGAVTPVHESLGGNYASEYAYDANGNLETLKRWADNAGVKDLIDDFTYNYTSGTNQLTHVDDAEGAAVVGDDLADQGVDNYTYTEIGELLSDDQEEIAEIQWKVTGKVHRIIRETTSDKSNLEFVYDAMGNRIIKIETDAGTDELIKKSYYIRDAQGNVMSIYTLDHLITPPEEPEALGLMLTERSIYGSSRIGTENPNELLARTDETLTPTIDWVQTVGDRNYELSNHLGNVLQVITDRKLAVETAPESGIVDYYVADVVSQSDYYPGGSLLPNRHETASTQYRYGFNGYEQDPEIKGEGNSYTTEFRQYDPRVFRWLSIDPVVKTHESPYMGHSGNPIWFADPNGADSTLAAGSRVWEWTVEKGDTYSGISERTGVSVENLRSWNTDGTDITDDYHIPVGSVLHLSDPTTPAPSSVPVAQVGQHGRLNVQQYDKPAKTFNGPQIIVEFTPDNGGEYRFIQTFETNDPIVDGNSDLNKNPNRVLGGMVPGDDEDAGTTAFDATVGNRFFSMTNMEYGTITRTGSNSVGHMDAPQRSTPTSSGPILWEGKLMLQQKVNGNFIDVQVIYFGFELHSDGTLIINDLQLNSDATNR